MTAQETFEELLQSEGKLLQYASLAEIGSTSPERPGIVETLLRCSGENRGHVDVLWDSFAELPMAYRPIVERFEELLDQMLRREDGWKKILHDTGEGSGALTPAAMSTVAWLCARVDEPLQAIVADLQGLAAASAIQDFLEWGWETIEQGHWCEAKRAYDEISEDACVECQERDEARSRVLREMEISAPKRKV